MFIFVTITRFKWCNIYHIYEQWKGSNNENKPIQLNQVLFEIFDCWYQFSIWHLTLYICITFINVLDMPKLDKIKKKAIVLMLH
jgi:hypothetical protein